jgi:glycosyltransferase involved in cell wall biosynthesis
LEGRDPHKRIDIVVLTRESQKTLLRCLRAIRESIDCNRLIVVDGGSRDKTLEIASKYADEIHVLPNSNIGEARDAALDLIKTDIFAFVDSDVVINKECFLKSMLLISQDQKVAAVQNRTMFVDRARHRTFKDSKYLSFAFVLLRTEPLKRSRIPHVIRDEDSKTGEKLRRLGYKWTVQKEGFCWHLHTTKDTWIHWYNYGRHGLYSGSPKYILPSMLRDFGRLGKKRQRLVGFLVKRGFLVIGYLRFLTLGGRRRQHKIEEADEASE